MEQPEEGYIHIKNAEANNLKGIDVDIPRNRLTVITGVSGSGKTSLAFDTPTTSRASTSTSPATA